MYIKQLRLLMPELAAFALAAACPGPLAVDMQQARIYVVQ